MAIASRRRRRRPRWLLIAAVVTAVVLAVNTAVSARSKGPSRRLAELAYLDEVRPQVERSTAEGADVEQVRAGAGVDWAGVARTSVRFLASWPPGAPAAAGAMPPSVWAADREAWSRGAVGALVSAMRASATLAPVHDVSVVLVTTDPAAVAKD